MTMVDLTTNRPEPRDTTQKGSTMSTTPTTPTRVPPPGGENPTQRAARTHYETDTEGRYTNLTVGEKAAVAHLRGWVHFGPLCPLCGGGAR